MRLPFFIKPAEFKGIPNIHAHKWECQTCGHEWPKDEAPEVARVVKDAHGTILTDGDSVVLIKDLKLRGCSGVLKGGSKVKNIRLVRFLGWERAIEGEISGKLGRYIVMSAIRHAATIAVWAISYSWSTIPLLAILLFAAMKQESVSLMEVFSSFWLLDHIVTQLQWIPYSLSMYGAATAGCKRALELLSQPDLSERI